MALEKPGVVFTIHVDKGDITGKSWHGDFRAKETLSFGDQIRIDRIRRDLLGPGPYDGCDPEVMAQATILAQLQVCITEAPEWWVGGVSHADFNLLRSIYEEALKIREGHTKEIEKQGEDAQKALRESAKK
jgi:hypothetical protein